MIGGFGGETPKHVAHCTFCCVVLFVPIIPFSLGGFHHLGRCPSVLSVATSFAVSKLVGADVFGSSCHYKSHKCPKALNGM